MSTVAELIRCPFARKPPLAVAVATLALLLTLTCSGEAAEPTAAVDFDTQVIPVLTKAGCNSGACHGSAAGRGGFALSLYGSRPADDHQAIALELEGRRINLAKPDSSLLLQKPTGWKVHGGDIRLEETGPGYTVLHRWIQQGGRRLTSRRLVSFQLQPAAISLPGPGSRTTVTATATFDDGTSWNATPFTVFAADDATAVQIDSDPSRAAAELTVQRRGRHLIIARYLDQVLPLEVIVPLADTTAVTAPATAAADTISANEPATDVPASHKIDQLVQQKLQILGLQPSGSIDDSAFLRRVSLDLTGRLPTPEQAQNFLQQTAPPTAQLTASGDQSARTRLVDQLLQSPEFVDYWTWKFAELLRIRGNPESDAAAQTYHRWLRQQLQQGVPYDELAKQLLLAEGDAVQQGPASFYQNVGDARAQAEFVAELMLGVRLRCANCHDHPLDHWTQDDYHGLAAIFARIEPGRVIRERSSGAVIHPGTAEAAVPRIPGEEFLTAAAPHPRRQLTEWIVAAENPYFARAIVNRIWKSLLGRGLVEPADDLRATNPATHPQLLQQLAADFVAADFDLRHTIRQICLSQTYARSAVSTAQNAADDRYYSHALVRPLSAEVLVDAISDVTGVAETFGDLPAGTRAIQLVHAGTPSTALDILGRCDREDSCETSGTTAAGLTQKLHLLNGELLNSKLADPAGQLATLLADNRTTPQQIVTEFYQRALTRLPTDQEIRYWNSQFAETENPEHVTAVAEDFLWSLLTCQEFVTNH